MEQPDDFAIINLYNFLHFPLSNIKHIHISIFRCTIKPLPCNQRIINETTTTMTIYSHHAGISLLTRSLLQRSFFQSCMFAVFGPVMSSNTLSVLSYRLPHDLFIPFPGTDILVISLRTSMDLPGVFGMAMTQINDESINVSPFTAFCGLIAATLFSVSHRYDNIVSYLTDIITSVVFVSQTLKVPSVDTLTILFPSFMNIALFTNDECPLISIIVHVCYRTSSIAHTQS